MAFLDLLAKARQGAKDLADRAQEGGEVARSKPRIRDIPIVKLEDKSSPSLASSACSGCMCGVCEA